MNDAQRYLSQELPALLDVLQLSDVRELEVREGDVRVRVRRTPNADLEHTVELVAEETAAAEELSTCNVTSPLVGTFYRAESSGMPPLVEEGSVVEEDTIVGIVEALRVLTEVEAGCAGVVTRVFGTDGQPVEYGQPLFEVGLSG